MRSAQVEIVTQRGFPASSAGPSCCVDMVFTLGRGRRIGVENKLFAEEGKDQLRNYLRLDLTRVAYITARDTRVENDVRNCDRYLKPARGHFLWADFHPQVESCATRALAPLLTKALLELFQHFGFEPPKPEIGDLLDPDESVRRANRENFVKLWETTRLGLSRLGWKQIDPGSIAELYVDDGPPGLVKRVWLDPTWGRGLLRVRVTPHEGKLTEVEERLLAAELPHREDLEIYRGRGAGRVRDPEYADVTISLRKLMGGTADTSIMKDQLAEFVLAVLRAAVSVCEP